MAKQQQLTIRMDEELYRLVKSKCKEQFGIGLSPLIKIFLKSFVTPGGMGFFVGDENLHRLIANWCNKKYFEKYRKRSAPLPGPRLKDILGF